MPSLEHDKYYHIYNRGNNGEDLFCCAEDYTKFLVLYEKYIDPIAYTYSWVLMKNHFHLLVRIKTEEEIGYYLPLNADRSGDCAKFKTTGSNNLTESEGPVRVVENNTGSEGNNLTESEGPVRVRPGYTNNSQLINPDRPEDVVRLNSDHLFNSDRSCDSVRLKRQPDPTRHFSHLFNSYAKYFNQKYQRTGSLFESPFKRIEVNTNEYFKTLLVYIHTNPVHHGFTEDFTSYPWSSYQSLLSSEPTRLKRDEIIDWFNDIENLKYMHQMKINTQLISDILLE